MKDGLEGFVEFLLPELAFAGEQGMTVDGFLALTKQYFASGKSSEKPPQQTSQTDDGTGTAQASKPVTASTTLTDAELSFARGAWTWMTARPNVLIGGDRRWNKLSLDEVLALPDADASKEVVANSAQGVTAAPGDTPASEFTLAPGITPVPADTPLPGTAPVPEATPTPAVSSAQKPTSTKKQRSAKHQPVLTTRPRIQVTEETVWQAITGHGVDYKQIPRLEWHLLQAIATTKHEGILQGDVRRLVGQDKRSVPKRTDFLATKGYIVKRSVMIRASKTSKLWLAGFAPKTTADGSEASGAKDVKMTKEILTRDLSPVPWHAKWTGKDIDVETFAESLIAIVKAWGVMRYSDVRLKMGVDELRWQMRTMARLTRSLVDMGIIKYTAAVFPNSRKVWKDCVKFIRDPTEAEWTKLLSTGKKTSKYTDLSKDRQPKPFALSLADKAATQSHATPKKSTEEDPSGATQPTTTTSGLSGWVPEKPLQQTLFEAVDAAGPSGATNPQISAGTVGYSFRRYIGTMLTNMAMCKQPPHLEKFQLDRKLVRVDKTSAFIYTTKQSAQSTCNQEQPGQPSTAVSARENSTTAETPALEGSSMYGFRAVPANTLAGPSASLSEVSRKLRGRHMQNARAKRRFGAVPSLEGEDGRSPKRRRVGGAQAEVQPQGPIERLPGMPPGVYKGEPNSLNPNRKKTGRPRASKVIIFRSEKLKDPAFWRGEWTPTRNPDDLTFLNVQYNGIPGRLCLDTKDKTIVFTRKAQPGGKDPLSIQLDNLREEPVVRPVPGCEDRSLVFVTKEAGAEPSWTFIFLFKDDAISQERIAEILKRVKSIADGEPVADEPPPPPAKAPEDAGTAAHSSGGQDTRQGPEPTPPAQAVEPTPSLEPIQPAEPTQSVVPLQPAEAAQSVENAAVVENPTTAAPETSTPPWKVKGPGKGRGKKDKNQRPWKCEKCGNSWKNDIGLKYHLTKAQVPCNPSFVAQPVATPTPKRKAPPVLPTVEKEPANGGAAADLPSSPRVARPRASERPKRKQIKLKDDGVPAFRGLTFDESYLDSTAVPHANTVAQQSSGAAVSQTARPLEVSCSAERPSPVASVNTAIRNGHGNFTRPTENVPMILSSTGDDKPAQCRPLSLEKVNTDSSAGVTETVRSALSHSKSSAQRTAATEVDAPSDSGSLGHSGLHLDDVPLIMHQPPVQVDINTPHTDRATNKRSVPVKVAVGDAGTTAIPGKEPGSRGVSTAPGLAVVPSETSQTPLIQAVPPPQWNSPNVDFEMATAVPSVASEVTKIQDTAGKSPTDQLQPQHSTPQIEAESKTQDVGTSMAASSTPVKAKEAPRRRPLPDKPIKRQQDQAETGPRPFKPAHHYAHLSTDSKIRTMQALDIVEYLLENNGGIFPGGKALFYAVLKIYLKAFSGQMPPTLNNLKVACRKLTVKGKAREIVHAFRTPTGKHDTSVMFVATGIDPNGLVPTVVQRKIQEAWPGVFIPPAFSPSKEELRLLEKFDGEPAETEETTPKPQGKFRGRRDNMEVEIMSAPYYQENPQEVGGHHAAVNGQATSVGHPSVGDTPKKRRKRGAVADPASGPSAKKQKTLGSKLLGLPSRRTKGDDAAQEVSDDDTGAVEPPSSEPEVTAQEPSTIDNTPIASAIKAYGLLPTPRTGPKKKRPVDSLVKLPKEIGRAQNPGLTSLPHFFFTNRYNEFWSHNTHSTRLTFLEPNTRLDDYHITSWFEDLGDSVALTDETSSIASEDEEAMSSAESEELRQGEGFAFVPIVFLREYKKGSWPKNPPKELFDKSVQMRGWIPSTQDILGEHLPRDIHEMASWNKRKRVKLDLYADKAFATFCELIDRCEGWEQSAKGAEMMTHSTIAPSYRFMNASPAASVCQMQPIIPVWDEENQFSLETFPYQLATRLAEEEDEEPEHKKPKLDLLGRKPRGRPPVPKPSPKKDQVTNPKEKEPKEKKKMGRPKRIRLPALEVEREHTAYPQSAEEYMDIHHGAERTPEWNSEHTQLAAFVCVTTLLGGVAKSVDWGIMMRLFPDMSLSHLRKFFGEMNKDRKSTIIDLTEKFQKAFLEAYEKGELPPLDYDNVLAYDWKSLTLWTRGLAGDESTLPPSYAELEKRDMIVSDRTHQPRDWRETFWLPARSLYNRYQDSSSQALAMTIEPVPETEEEDVNLRAAMSWVRALCMTQGHPPEIVSDKWETFRGLPRRTISDLIDQSIRILQERLVITKDKNLIVMRLNDRVVKALEKAAQDQKYAEAGRFKRRLDRAFRKGKARYRIPYTADDDGLTMALLNLQAHGRVTVETDNKYVPLGYEPFNYETRKFDRKYHHFRLWAVPTDTYLYSTLPEDYDGEESDELATLLANIQAATPPVEGKEGELPLWVNFFGKVDEARWRKCMGAVLFMLSSRGPMRADAIAEQLKCFVPFEVELVLEWAEKLGLLEQMTPGAPKCVTEWWWLAVEAQWRRAEAETRREKKGKGKVTQAVQGQAAGSAAQSGT